MSTGRLWPLRRRAYFEGWYFKQQSKTGTIAFIPALHVGGKGKASASLQVITDRRSCSVTFPREALYVNRKQFFIRLGNSTFTEQGCSLDVKMRDCNLQGALSFGPFTPPAYDIMGPFRMVPGMECRHSVFSLYHPVDGALTFNGRQFLFENGSGYLEGDRGTSFPKRYLWTQCSWKGNSIMLSVADIPFGGRSFVGCVGIVYYEGREYRLATYRGARLLYVNGSSVLLRQGNLILRVKLLEGQGHPLQAPQRGDMTRIIHEKSSCRVQYTCSIKNRTLFDFTGEHSSFEDNWEEEAETAPG